ncbi:uncharacterized protein NESG_01889 [Nematocida ausubeli]|uniref:Uncharacterized protein n=1 Tax=Nematocida ausubeli (strain ATCC PRA-371 / ERTm2) TaxID=1913371 RepID=A0A086J182_NEMA1|nr:uncharacterized protein NESG_01889 [Nematocida ausubeli]KFG25900.1 hypothetical protein NESG_01889 [Nematocida ausubeli]
MVSYVRTSEAFKTHIIGILCMVVICMFFRARAANTEYNSNSTEINTEQASALQEIYKNDTAYNPEEPLDLSIKKKTYTVVRKFYLNNDGTLFYINRTNHKIYIHFTEYIANIDEIFYRVYTDALGNLVYINIAINPYASGKYTGSSIAQYALNSPAGALPMNERKRTYASTSSNSYSDVENPRNTKIKEKNGKSAKHRFIITRHHKKIYTSIQQYINIAHSNLIRDKPNGFSYWFDNSAINNENPKCNCVISMNNKNIVGIWRFIIKSTHVSLNQKINCIKQLINQKGKENINKQLEYYYSFLEGLNEYIESHINTEHIRAKYDYTDSSKNNICSVSKTEPETLGEIYEETQTDLKWWANSMSIIYAKTEKMKKECSIDDAALKEKLHFILKLPEVLRDLVLITPEILVKTKEEMEKIFGSDTSRVFCIIEYLYYLVNDDADKMNIAYNEVKSLFVNEESICTCTTMEVYRAVYNVFCSFYQCAPFTCVADIKSEEDNPEKKEARTKRIFQSYCPYIPKSGVFRLRGKRAIVRAQIKGYIQTVELPMPNQQENQMSELVSDFRYFNSELNTEFLNIASSGHYHVQLVDNTRHTVKLIPIPMINPSFTKIHKDQTHSIQCIVEYIKSILRSTYPEKSSDFNVYPFKYDRIDKTWLLINKEKAEIPDEISLTTTIHKVNNCGYDVVFYYFKEDIDKTLFVPVDFMCPVASKTEKAPRIPLFLTEFMLVNTAVGPYIADSLVYINLLQFISSSINIKINTIFRANIHTDINSRNPSDATKNTNILQLERSYIDYYYSDFFILNIYEKKVCTAECFSMFSTNEVSLNTPKLSIKWITQIKKSVSEYTSYWLILDPNQNIQKKDQNKCDKTTVSTLLSILQSESSSGDKVTYGLCIYHRFLDGKEVAVPIMCEKMRRLLSENIDGELRSKYAICESDILPPRIDIKDIKESTSVFITVKTFNYTQANLGMHYDMLAALFHNKNKSTPVIISTIRLEATRKPETVLT